MIKFNVNSITDLERKYVLDALDNRVISGDGKYTFKVYEQFKELFGINKMLLTTSGSAALEMAAILADLKEGDEVIVPSFTFSSTVNAFMLRGARPVFCDVEPGTMNINADLIEGLITDRTKAIFPIDYAGVPCDLDKINAIAKRHNLLVVDDAAQAVGSTYKGQPCGTQTPLACFSFHESKNYIMGEGGALVINDLSYKDRAEIIREKGTNRTQVLAGVVDKYTWHDVGSSYLPSDVLAAILSAQMTRFNEILTKRLAIWNTYYERLKPLEDKGLVELPRIPSYAKHNGHLFNVLLSSEAKRKEMIDIYKQNEISAYICYVPLHSAPVGLRLGYKPEDLPVTNDRATRLLRLPLYTDLALDDVNRIADIMIKNI